MLVFLNLKTWTATPQNYFGKAKVKDVKFDHLPAFIFKNGFTWLIYDHSDPNLI